jgi:hypothetical protein
MAVFLCVTACANRVIILFTLVGSLADLIGAS